MVVNLALGGAGFRRSPQLKNYYAAMLVGTALEGGVLEGTPLPPEPPNAELSSF